MQFKGSLNLQRKCPLYVQIPLSAKNTGKQTCNLDIRLWRISVVDGETFFANSTIPATNLSLCYVWGSWVFKMHHFDEGILGFRRRDQAREIYSSYQQKLQLSPRFNTDFTFIHRTKPHVQIFKILSCTEQQRDLVMLLFLFHLLCPSHCQMFLGQGPFVFCLSFCIGSGIISCVGLCQVLWALGPELLGQSSPGCDFCYLAQLWPQMAKGKEGLYRSCSPYPSHNNPITIQASLGLGRSLFSWPATCPPLKSPTPEWGTTGTATPLPSWTYDGHLLHSTRLHPLFLPSVLAGFMGRSCQPCSQPFSHAACLLATSSLLSVLAFPATCCILRAP